ncbi:hypothetical protein [Parapedobacter koreensis]|nr:hypothetical protein [Parapedobacter koreensis]
MVRFEKLTCELLQLLEAGGYTVLTSVSGLCDENPTYVPERITDLWGYLGSINVWSGGLSEKETNLLVIRDALENILPEDLRGVVLLFDD